MTDIVEIEQIASDQEKYVDPFFSEYQFAPRKRNSLALWSFIVSFFCGIVAIFMGYRALRQILRDDESGSGFAKAAIVIGWITIGSSVITFLFLLTWMQSLGLHSA